MLLLARCLLHRALMRFMRRLAIFGVGVSYLSGCAESTPPATNVTSKPLTRVSDFRSLTGSDTSSILSYRFSDGLFLRTNYLLDSRLDIVSGLSPNGPSILGSSIGGISASGQELAGKSIIGTELVAFTYEGKPHKLYIDDVIVGEGGNSDLLYYRVSVHRDGAKVPLCGDQLAIALPGAWDLSSGRPGDGGWLDANGFFFACRESTVAKCYEMGFKPWKFQEEDETILNLHEACVRALRADYSGDGVAGTVSEIEVVLSTDPAPALADGFELEATWSVDGAICQRAARVPGLAQGPSELPDCSNTGSETGTVSDGSLLYSFVRRGLRAHASCEVQADLRSITARQLSLISISNPSDEDVRLHWRDYSGSEALILVLPPGASTSLFSFVSHAWVLTRADGSCIQTFTVDGPSVAVVAGEPVAPRPSLPVDPSCEEPQPSPRVSSIRTLRVNNQLPETVYLFFHDLAGNRHFHSAVDASAPVFEIPTPYTSWTITRGDGSCLKAVTLDTPRVEVALSTSSP